MNLRAREAVLASGVHVHVPARSPAQKLPVLITNVSKGFVLSGTPLLDNHSGTEDYQEQRKRDILPEKAYKQ